MSSALLRTTLKETSPIDFRHIMSMTKFAGMKEYEVNMTLLQRMEKGADKGANKGGSRKKPTRRAGYSDFRHHEIELGYLKSRIQTELFAKLDPSFSNNPPRDARTHIEALFNEIVDAIPAEENVALSDLEKTQLFEAIALNILGFGPLAALM